MKIPVMPCTSVISPNQSLTIDCYSVPGWGNNRQRSKLCVMCVIDFHTMPLNEEVLDFKVRFSGISKGWS